MDKPHPIKISKFNILLSFILACINCHGFSFENQRLVFKSNEIITKNNKLFFGICMENERRYFKKKRKHNFLVVLTRCIDLYEVYDLL